MGRMSADNGLFRLYSSFRSVEIRQIRVSPRSIDLMSKLSKPWVTAVAAVFSIMLIGCGPGKTQIPTSHVVYNSKGGAFQCEVPEGWEIKGGGKRGPEWAKIQSGSAIIQIDVNISGSLINDAAGGSRSNSEMPQFDPIHLLHVGLLEDAQDNYHQYTELPGSPIVMQCDFGPGRVSEFTAKGSGDAELHGYRASIMGHERMLTLFCVSRESDWQALKPTFDRVIATLDRGEWNR